MQVKYKKLYKNSVRPQKAHADDAGFDLVANSRYFDEHGAIVYGTGLAFEIPQGYVGLLFARSSIAKKDLQLSNCVGVLDSGYRGEVFFKFKPTLTVVDKKNFGKDEDDIYGSITNNWDDECVTFYGRDKSYPDIPEGYLPFQPRMFEVGERIGQLIIMPYPEIEFEEAETLSQTERGTGGYGSSGK